MITPDSSFLYDAFNKYKVIVARGFCVKLGSGMETEKPVFTSSQETEYFEFVFKWKNRSSHSDVFIVKDVLKKCSKSTGQHPCWSVVSIKLHRYFIEITLWHWCSPVNLLPIFKAPFTQNTSWCLLEKIMQLNARVVPIKACIGWQIMIQNLYTKNIKCY